MAARRRGAHVTVVPVAGIDVPTFYHRIGDIGASLGDDFSLDAVIGIGVMVPPPYLEPRWQQVPPVVAPRRRGNVDRVAGIVAAASIDSAITC